MTLFKIPLLHVPRDASFSQFSPHLILVASKDLHEDLLEYCCKVMEYRGIPQEAKNWPHIPLQEKCHRAILEGVKNISDTL